MIKLRKNILTIVVALVMFFLSLIPVMVYAEPADPNAIITLRFYDEEGNRELTTKQVRYGRSTKIPTIRKDYLSDDYRDNDQITSCWVLSETEEAWYPGDEFFVEDTYDYVITGDLKFTLVPDDTSLDYDRARIFFYDNTYEDIESYQFFDARVGSEITLPDPAPYGRYWYISDANGQEHLYKKGDSYKVPEESSEFMAVGNETVSITYLYPIDQEIADGNEPGSQYATESVKVGDFITLKSSPGNIVFGCTFKGWECTTGTYDDILQAGKVIQIMKPEDLEFAAYYEEDENWDPSEGNEEDDVEMLPDGLVNENTEELSNNAGIGVDVVINNNPNNASFGGTLSKDGGTYTKFTQNDTKKTMQNGSITTSTKVDPTLSNPNEDQYGRKLDQGGDPTKPLLQDDSLFGMDIYGNAFAYPYWADSEAERIEIVTNRLKQYKGNSWVNFIDKNPDLADAVARFEAREMDLLKDSCNDKLKIDRTQWRGWMDYYSDIPGTTDTNRNNFSGETNRILARVKMSNAWENITFFPYYYDPNKTSAATYGFGALSGISTETMGYLETILNTLIRAGYSEQAATGVCAILLERTNGSLSPTYSGTNGTGIGAWDESTTARFKEIAEQTQQDWENIQTQADLLVIWLGENIQELNNSLKDNTGALIKDFKKVAAPKDAVDAYCVAFFEGSDERDDNAVQLFDGKYYTEAKKMREYADKLKAALKKTESGYGFDLSSLNLIGCSEARRTVVEMACAQVGKPYVWGTAGPNTFDCSGLTSWAYKQIGIDLPRKSSLQINAGRKISKVMLRPGDLIVWDGHVAMYIGNGQMVEAVGKDYGIKINSIDRKSKKTFLGYVSVLD